MSPTLLHAIAQIVRTPAALSFVLAALAPRWYQRRRLRQLLRASQGTEYGRAHGFDAIRDLDAYREAVPLMSAGDLSGWVDRLMQGERNLLTAEPPLFYGRTTGTSGRPKDIPITATFRRDFQRSVLVSLWFCFWRVPAAFRHKILYFVAPRCDEHAPDGVEVGSISGYNFTEMPAGVQSLYAWPYALVEVTDPRTRWYLAVHIAARQAVSVIAGIFPIGVLQMLYALEEHAEALAAHTAAGTFPDWLVLTEDQEQAFAAWKAPDPDAAARLSAAARAAPEQQAAIAFPALRAVFCWKTATASHYIPALQARLGPNILVRDTVYSATEGWCSSPMGTGVDGGPLTLTSHVYEFLPVGVVEAVDGDLSSLRHAPTLRPDELVAGERYYIILSTSAGLYRYFLGDVLAVTGRWARAPWVHFARKQRAFSNLAGEKLEETHVTQSVGEALEELGASAAWFAMMPLTGAQPGYRLYIELGDDNADPARLADLAARLGERLRANNADWITFSKDGTLAPLEIHQLRAGAGKDGRLRWEKEGRSVGQLKLSHLVTRPEQLPCVPGDLRLSYGGRASM